MILVGGGGNSLNIAVVGPMLSHIIVTILPLLKMCLEGVINILTYLIVENQYVVYQ